MAVEKEEEEEEEQGVKNETGKSILNHIFSKVMLY